MNFLKSSLFTLLLATAQASSCPYDPAGSATKAPETSSVVVSAMKSLITDKTGNVYSIPSKKPSLAGVVSQRFQIHTIQNPKGFLAKTLQPIISLFEGAPAAFSLPKRRRRFGENFCVAGMVVLGNFEEVSRALTSPQARTYRLGSSLLDSKRLTGNKRNTWVSKRHGEILLKLHVTAGYLYYHHL